MKFVATRRFEFFDDFLGSQAHAEVAANGAHSYDVDVNGTKIGQIDFAAAAQTATFSTTGATTEVVEIGERVDVRAPATADSALSGIAFSLVGRRIQ
jgi:hypothetical protein